MHVVYTNNSLKHVHLHYSWSQFVTFPSQRFFLFFLMGNEVFIISSFSFGQGFILLDVNSSQISQFGDENLGMAITYEVDNSNCFGKSGCEECLFD